MLTQAVVCMLLCRQSPKNTTGMVQRSSTSQNLCKSELWVQMVNIYIYTRESTLIQNSNTLESDRPQYDQPATCINTQHIRPPPSPHAFSPTQKNLVHVSKLLLFQFLLGHQRLCKSKLCILKLLMSGSVCKFQQWLPSKFRHYNII